MVYISTPMLGLAMITIKPSLLACYSTLSLPGSNFRRQLYFWTTFITLSLLTIILILLFPCRPISKAWNVLTPGHCLDLNRLYFTQAGFMTFTDLIVCILPIPMVFRMKLPLRQKVSVCGLFALGAIAVVSGIIKLTMMPELLKSFNVAWNSTTSLVWLNIELMAGAIAGSGVPLKVFVRRWAPGLLSRSGESVDDGDGRRRGVRGRRRWGMRMRGRRGCGAW